MEDKNPWSREFWNLTEQGKIIKQHGIERAEQMAEAAGSRVGATRPVQAEPKNSGLVCSGCKQNAVIIRDRDGKNLLRCGCKSRPLANIEW